MKNILSYLIFTTFLLTFNASLANIIKGEWSFTKDPEYCYIGSAPDIIDIPSGKKRGDTYVLVYRINKSKEPVVQIVAGYPFDENSEVKIIIDNNNFSFPLIEEDTAFTDDDRKIILAMKKGMQLTVIGKSSRGTQTKDIYNLKGFTSAYNKLFDDC